MGSQLLEAAEEARVARAAHWPWTGMHSALP